VAATNYAVLIPRVRTFGNDTPTGNLKLKETPDGVRDGSNALFRLSYPNPVAATIYMTYGAGIVRQPAGSGTFQILDGPSGYIKCLGAGVPDQSVTQPFFFDYFYQWFLDADYTTMLDSATDELGGVAGTDLPEGLYPAQCQYALDHYWMRRSSLFANSYQSSGGGASANPATPPVNFAKLAAAARKKGDELRDAFYLGFRKPRAPASGTVTYGFSKGTPKR